MHGRAGNVTVPSSPIPSHTKYQFVSRPIASEALCLHMNFNEPNEETLCNTLKSLLLKHCAQRVQA